MCCHTGVIYLSVAKFRAFLIGHPLKQEISYLVLLHLLSKWVALSSAQNYYILLKILSCSQSIFGIFRSTKCIQNQWQHYVRIAYSGERMVYQSFGSHGTRKSICNDKSAGQALTEPCHVSTMALNIMLIV